MLLKRRGSILATSISLTAIILTMVLGAAAYLEQSTKAARGNRWRDVAEEAARTGMDFVLGWGEQNIDRVSKLPTEWEDIGDENVLDPVLAHVGAVTSNDPAGVQAGQVLGDNLGEYVLGRYGNYLVTFKARVQQYRYSTNMPPQYRIGVIGRVRQVGRNNDADSDEKDGVIAERMMMTNIGKEPTSRYAALIDIDMVRNWVPGEHVWGPVHINRGYPDDPGLRAGGRTLNETNNADSVNYNPNGTAVSVDLSEVRSRMRLHTQNSSVGFTGVNGVNHPIFHEEVSVTAFTAGVGPYTHADPTASSAIQFDDGLPGVYNPAHALANSIFAANANKNLPEWGGDKPGPVVRSQPVELPRSVRGAMSVALGIPVGDSPYNHRCWLNTTLPDGVYVPTANWWANGVAAHGNMHPTMTNVSAADAGDGAHAINLNYNGGAAGGIYIRGNVEVMRMTVLGDNSYYFFQLGYGEVPGRTGTSVRRVYGIRVNRTGGNNAIRIRAFPRDSAQYLHTRFPDTGNMNTLFNGGADTDNPLDFAIDGTGNVRADIDGGAGFPFNGIVFVDLSNQDPARHAFNPMLNRVGARPLTGNIFALGDPGATTNPITNKRGFPGVAETYEQVATYRGSAGNESASKLTIMAVGNIFIQNNIYLRGIINAGVAPTAIGENGSSLTLGQCSDLLGLVCDKQVVVGLHAPNGASRTGQGVTVHAAIAALGDPGLDFDYAVPEDALNPGTLPFVPKEEMEAPRAYRGSFSTEGIMQEFNRTPPMDEQYNVCVENPRTLFYYNRGKTGVPADPAGVATVNASLQAVWDANPSIAGYPGNPLYTMAAYAGPGALATTAFARPDRVNNPNRQPRGRMVIFGSVTTKKRGVVGVSNKSYDKDFRFDRRLLTISPPLFPSSTNLVVRSVRPFGLNPRESATRFPYRTGGNAPAAAAGDALYFMSRRDQP